MLRDRNLWDVAGADEGWKVMLCRANGEKKASSTDDCLQEWWSGALEAHGFIILL